MLFITGFPFMPPKISSENSVIFLYAKKALTFDVKKHRVNMFDFLILVNAEREKMSKRYKGILCILAAAFCFAIMNASVRASGELPAMQKAFFRNIETKHFRQDRYIHNQNVF